MVAMLRSPLPGAFLSAAARPDLPEARYVHPNSGPSRIGGDGLLSLRQLAEGATQAPLLDAAGHITAPVALVDLDVPADPGLLAEARQRAAEQERVLVGLRTSDGPDERWAELLAALDVTVTPAAGGPGQLRTCGGRVERTCVGLTDPASGARMLRDAAAATPQAAVALAQVLRAGESLDVAAALSLESFAYSTLLGGSEFRRWLAGREPRPAPAAENNDAVVAERDGDLLRITLNRPARRNAYSRELRDALVDALLLPVLDPMVQHIVITGAGPSFSSGGDLDEFGTAPDTATAHFIRTSAGAAGLLHRIADRTEVRVDGACVGAGVELPAFAANVVSKPGATFRLPEVGMGLIPGAGGTVSIPRRIGRWRALYLALSGVPLDALTAVDWGLVNQVTFFSLSFNLDSGLFVSSSQVSACTLFPE